MQSVAYGSKPSMPDAEHFPGVYEWQYGQGHLPEHLTRVAGQAAVSLDTIDATLHRVSGSDQLSGPDLPSFGPESAPYPQVRLASDEWGSSWERAKVRNEKIIGKAALTLAGVGEPAGETQERSLSELFKAAREGDPTASEIVRTDCVSEVSEQVCKTGAKFTAKAEFKDGAVSQYGRTTEQRQLNTRTTYTHKYRGLDQMSIAEGHNALAIEEAIASGAFKKGDVAIECSLVPAEDHAALKGSGLFLREVVAIVRFTRLGEGNEVVFDSYLVGGTDQSKLPPIEDLKTKADEEAAEKTALENRFDIAAFRELFSQFGHDNTKNMSPSEILSNMHIVRGENGREVIDGIDVLTAYDDIVSRITGAPVMMGSADLYNRTVSGEGRPLTREDYESHFAKMDELQSSLQSVGEVVERQCVERWEKVAGDDYEAGRLMHKLAEQAVVKYLAESLIDEVSDPDGVAGTLRPDMTVMGVRTYHNLMEFQASIVQGDIPAANRAFARAGNSAQGTGCMAGGRAKKLSRVEDVLDAIDSLIEEVESSDLDEDDDGLGPLVFKCTEGHVNVREKGELLKICRVEGCKPGSVGCNDKE